LSSSSGREDKRKGETKSNYNKRNNKDFNYNDKGKGARMRVREG
jgi:hypothetical protein